MEIMLKLDENTNINNAKADIRLFKILCLGLERPFDTIVTSSLPKMTNWENLISGNNQNNANTSSSIKSA